MRSVWVLHVSVAHGMTQKQNSGSNQCISIYTAILSPGNKC